MTETTSSTNGPLWGWAAQDWADIQEQFARPVYEATFDRVLQSGMRYLDAGCGAGLALQIAADRGAIPFGLDASENLLAIARARVPAADLRQGEIEFLPYDDSSFDLVTGFNSFQFAANPPRALAEAKRVAKPGAPVVIMTWGSPEGMPAAVLVTCLKHLMPPHPPGTPGPFALSDEAKLRAFAAEAGLTPEDVIDTPVLWHFPDLNTALRGLTSTGVCAVAIARTSREQVEQAFTDALVPFRNPDGSYTAMAGFRSLITRA
jgi:SAM-dependent methyltransferase